MSKKLYNFKDHPEHEAMLPEWRDKWIANALNCKPMDDEEREICRKAVAGMFDAAGLEQPKHIVFVPSPFVLRVAGGIAASRWHGVDDATYDATDAATRAATDAATYDATDDATRAVMYAATYAATRAATYAATRDATDDATRAVMYAATYDATDDATDDASRLEGKEYYAPWKPEQIKELATALSPHPELALKCVVRYWGWDGGNQWSGWGGAYLSFFQDVAKLELPKYEKYKHYRALCEHSGPRITHEKFVMISDRPCYIHQDEQNRPHCEDGPFTEWRDGSKIYAIHGTYVPQYVIEHPKLVTVENINAESNAEVRRIMIDRYGAEKYLVDSGCESVDFDGGNNVQGGAPREIVKDKNGDKWMIGTDGSTERVYTMPVPDTVKTCEQADQQLSGLKSFKLVSEG